MNWKVIKDRKAVMGLTAAFILSMTGIVLALNNSEYWVVSVTLSFIILIVSVRRADKVYRGS
jgi:hypothetical protein